MPRPQSPGLDDDRPIPQTIEELASVFLAEIDSTGAEDPLHFAGMSFGGIVAFEMARQATANGRIVAFVGMFDTFLAEVLPEFKAQRLPSTKAFLRRRVGDALGRTRREARRIMRGRDQVARANEYRHFTRVLHANDDALAVYEPGRYHGAVTFFAATSHDPELYRVFAERTSCRLDVVPVGGDHLGMLEPPHVAGLAAAVASVLRRT